MKRLIALLVVLVMFTYTQVYTQDKDLDNYVKRGETIKLEKFLAKNPGYLKKHPKRATAALFHAVNKQNIEIARILLKEGADPNAAITTRDYSIFYYAVISGDTVLTKLFLANGVDVNYLHRSKRFDPRENIEEQYAQTILGAVIRSCDRPILKLFLEKGADVHLANEINSGCMRSIGPEKLGHLKLLLEYGADINSRDYESTTFLMNAAGRNMTKASPAEIQTNEKFIRFVLENGINIEAKDDMDWTALHFAVWYNNFPALKILLEAGADPEVRSPIHSSPLKFAKKLKRTQMLPLL